MCFVVLVKGEMVLLKRAIVVQKGMKSVERKMRERFWRRWRTVGDWPVSGIVILGRGSLERTRGLWCH